MSWFDENGFTDSTADPANQTAAGPTGATPEQVTALYQQLVGRAPESPDVVNQWIQGTGGDLSKIKSGIAATSEAQAFAKQSAAPSGPPTLNQRDPSSVAAYVNYYASQPGANPSLKNDPNYWIGKISSGELGTDPNYIVGKFMTPEGAPSNGMASYGNLNGTPPPTFASNPNTPQFTPLPKPDVLSTPYTPQTFNGAPPPSAPTMTPFTTAAPNFTQFTQAPPSFTQFAAPTQAELEASPGYQSRLAAGLQAENRSAAAQGSVLNGGTQQALAKYGQDYASNEYNNLFGQRLAGNQNNNALLQTGYQDAFTANQANNGLLQTGYQDQFGANQSNNAITQQNFGDAYQNYLARYGQFSDAQSAALTGRQQNQNEFNTGVAQNQQGFQNNYQSYLDSNSRALSDYLTNVTTQRNAGNDYWSHLNDLYQTGANAANNSYKGGVGTL